jgi:DNA mismatch endonuclease (patch repair protein)
MTDILSSHDRSLLMAKVQGRDTKPELILRSALHRLGFRYSLNNRQLKGKPDIVFTKFRTVIFVHGCFWHCHEGCSKASIPKSNHSFWKDKLKKNVERDLKNKSILEEQGWNVIVVWECELYSDTIATIERVIDRLTQSGAADNNFKRSQVKMLDRRVLLKTAEQRVRGRSPKTVQGNEDHEI